MSSVTRDQVADALYALIAVTPPTVPNALGFKYSTRRLVEFANLGMEMQPAIFQTFLNETTTQRTGLRPTRRWHYRWIIACRSADPTDVNVTSDQIMDPLIDALTNVALGNDAQGEPRNCCTLGGLVYKASVDGRIMRNAGDANGQASAQMTITVLVP